MQYWFSGGIVQNDGQHNELNLIPPFEQLKHLGIGNLHSFHRDQSTINNDSIALELDRTLEKFRSLEIN